MWNKSYLQGLKFDNNKPICFIFTVASGNLPYQMHLFDFLRKTYPNCKVVLLLRDILAVGKKMMPRFDETNTENTFDAIYTINNVDAEKYGFRKIHSFCSQYPVTTDSRDRKSDVVFIGAVKDRLDTIVKAYEKFTNAGLICDFLLVSREPIDNVPEGVIVQNHGIPYSEMLRRTINSRCVLEVTQRGTDALTSRCLEALCYNKKLISDNFRLKDTQYYNPSYIHLFKDVDDIEPSFVKENTEIDYNYKGDFSPLKGLEIIERDLLRSEEE